MIFCWKVGVVVVVVFIVFIFVVFVLVGVVIVDVEIVFVMVDIFNQFGWWNLFMVDGDKMYFVYNVLGLQVVKYQVNLVVCVVDGIWIFGCLCFMIGVCVEYLDDNGYNQLLIVIDGDGYIYVFVFMYYELWKYFCFMMLYDVMFFVDVSVEMFDVGVVILYLVIVQGVDGDVWFMVCVGVDLQVCRDGVFYYYDLIMGMWSCEMMIVVVVNYFFYFDDFEVDVSGWVYVLWEWGFWFVDLYCYFGFYVVYDLVIGVFCDVVGQVLLILICLDILGVVVWCGYEFGEIIGDVVLVVQIVKMVIVDGEFVGVMYWYVDEIENVFDVQWVIWNGIVWMSEIFVDMDVFGSGVQMIVVFDIMIVGGEICVYVVVLVQDCGIICSQIVVLIVGVFGWIVDIVGDLVVGQQWFCVVICMDGIDVVYFSVFVVLSGGMLCYVEIFWDGQFGGMFFFVIVFLFCGDVGGVNLVFGGIVIVLFQFCVDIGLEKVVDGGCMDVSCWILVVFDIQLIIMVEWDQVVLFDVVWVCSGYIVGLFQIFVLCDFIVQFCIVIGWVMVGSIVDNMWMIVVIDVQDWMVDVVCLVIIDLFDFVIDVVCVYEIEVIVVY